jgi:hypothetical protein
MIPIAWHGEVVQALQRSVRPAGCGEAMRSHARCSLGGKAAGLQRDLVAANARSAAAVESVSPALTPAKGTGPATSERVMPRRSAWRTAAGP